MSKKILFIVGSLRQNSFNKQMAQIAEEMIGDRAAASSIHDKFFTVSSLANGESPKAVFKHYRELLPFIRTNVIGEFAGGPINPEAWATGKITLSESLHEKLANQVEEVLQELR